MNNENRTDLSEYQNRVLTDEDKPLFDEAVESARVGALRGAYILLWLSCLESLKRKFKEATLRDNTAQKIVGEFEEREKRHQSIDKFILSKAQEYGFVSDIAYQRLEHIYEMRCIFGHPYEEAPSVEEARQAAHIVVENVLSKPTTLKEGYVSSLIENLMESSYLDNYEPTVSRYVESMKPKIDESVYGYFVEKYMKEIEPVAADLSLELLTDRATWFLRRFLELVGCEIFNAEQWHNLVIKYPQILCLILAKRPELFKEITQNAQDSIVTRLIGNSNIIPSGLSDLECLYDDNALTKRQKDRFKKAIETSGIETLIASGLKTSTCFDKIIEALKSLDWYTQNPAVRLIMQNGKKNLGNLDANQAEILGRNILQAAEGNANYAIRFLDGWIEEPNAWPDDMLRGALLECFLDDDYEFRPKDGHLNRIMRILSKHEKKDELINFLHIKLKDSEPKQYFFSEDVEKTLNILSNYPEAALIIPCLKYHKNSKELMQLVEDFKMSLGQPGFPDFVRLETLLMPHERPILPKGHAAVYVFSIGDSVLIVGKADKDNQAQYDSPYSSTSSGPITPLAKCLIQWGEEKGLSLPIPLNKENVGNWIKQNTDRWNLIIDPNYSHDEGRIPETLMLFLIEKLQPVF